MKLIRVKKNDVEFSEADILREVNKKSAEISNKYTGIEVDFRFDINSKILTAEIYFSALEWNISNVKKLASVLSKFIDDVKKGAIELEDKFDLKFKEK